MELIMSQTQSILIPPSFLEKSITAHNVYYVKFELTNTIFKKQDRKYYQRTATRTRRYPPHPPWKNLKSIPSVGRI